MLPLVVRVCLLASLADETDGRTDGQTSNRRITLTTMDARLLRFELSESSRLLFVVQRQQTALHLAVKLGKVDIVGLLLAAGTQLTLRDSVITRS